ncbi:GNAT family N-acetyltransferase [Streptomyces ovatisporus]|uniref:GNAT family N-acetyltransferase n=1 Tax=Streptomyces ovatisporus TaxID=1128682 RepID=A0ABV9ABS6_9ACTN
MIVEPLVLTEGALSGALLSEITGLYASNREFHRLSGDFPDPDDIRPGQVAAAVMDELAQPHAQVLLARSAGKLTGIAATLAHHPDPADPDPWIGLLMVHADAQRAGTGRELAAYVEDGFRRQGRKGVRLAVLENNTAALRFWTATGYLVTGRSEDRERHRPCAVMRKTL